MTLFAVQRWELMNTAVLTGRQVSQPMKVLMVSQGGDVADITLHTSCSTVLTTLQPPGLLIRSSRD